MDVTSAGLSTQNKNEMTPIEVHHPQDINCDMNPAEEIVIQMDDDGYRVTSTSMRRIENQTHSVVSAISQQSEAELTGQEASSSSTSVVIDKNGSGSNQNGGAPEGFKIDVDEFGERVYKCEYCDYSSSKKNALLRDHYNHEHKKKVLECTECTYSTMRYKTLQQHRQNRHGLLAMECSFESDGAKCTFRSILEDVMIAHYATKHGIEKEPSKKQKEEYDRNILMKFKREGPDGKPVRRPHKHRLDRSQRVFDTIREENEKGGYTYT